MQDKYRFTSDEEPTDDQLAQLMREVAVDVRLRNAKAQLELRTQVHKEVEAAKARYAGMKQC